MTIAHSSANQPPPSLRRRIRRLTAAAVNRLTPAVAPGQPMNAEPETLAIIAQEKLGDAILLTPLIRLLKRHYPALQTHVIALSDVAEFFEHDPNIHRVYRPKENYGRYWREISRQSFDVLFSPKDHPSTTTLLHTRLIRARHKVGIAHPGHNGFFHHRLELDFYQHVIRKNCALLDVLGVSYKPADCRPYLPDGPLSPEVARFCQDHRQQRLIGLNLSAGESTREWPLKRWQDFIANRSERFVILAMPDRAADKTALEQQFNNVVPSPSTRSVYDAAELIRHLSLLISPDTALVHVAACYDVPVIGLYRSDPVHYRRFAPRVSHAHQLVSSSLTVADITIADVIVALDSLQTELPETAS